MADSGFWWEGREAKFALVGRLKDVSVWDLGSDTIGGRPEVGDWAIYREVVAGGTAMASWFFGGGGVSVVPIGPVLRR